MDHPARALLHPEGLGRGRHAEVVPARRRPGEARPDPGARAPFVAPRRRCTASRKHAVLELDFQNAQIFNFPCIFLAVAKKREKMLQMQGKERFLSFLQSGGFPLCFQY